MQTRSILAASALAVAANAQAASSTSGSVVTTTIAQSMPAIATAAFNPAAVNATDAFNWCYAQRNSCPQICNGPWSSNTCDPTAFTYSCVCANGTVPDCTAYIETLPYFMCTATYGQCILAHPMDAMGQSTCKQNEQCGTKNATALQASASSAAAAASSTASSSGASMSSTASASASTAATTSNAAVANSQHVATGAFAALLLAAFKLLV